MAKYNGVLVCGEVLNGKITITTRELLTIGRNLSNSLNEPLSIFLIGENSLEAANEAVYFNADKIYILNNDLSFPESHPDLHVAIITSVCQQVGASVILFGHTDMGRDVAPRLAARLGGMVVMDCVELSIHPETKKLLQKKPVFGGNAIAIWSSTWNGPQIITIRPRSTIPAEPETSRKGEIMTLKVIVQDSMIRGKLLEAGGVEVKGIKLEEAKVIVAGGGGIGSREGFKLLEELAEVLGGAVGVTRVPCDEGWMPISLEIGQTGHVVNPNLYIAVGISGAVQHMAGCSGSKCIVAINKDAGAHIFREANWGVVSDYREVLPIFINKCREMSS